MNRELLKKGVDMQDTPEVNNYQKYVELGGIINEKDYNSALERARDTSLADINKEEIGEVKNILNFAGIKSYSPLRLILYEILRRDIRPEKVKYHHDQMSDQKILVEVMRMLGDSESVDKMIKAHPHISFKYTREADK